MKSKSMQVDLFIRKPAGQHSAAVVGILIWLYYYCKVNNLNFYKLNRRAIKRYVAEYLRDWKDAQ